VVTNKLAVSTCEQ